MNISIDNRHVEHLRSKVESGSYPTLDAALDKALELLDAHDEHAAAAITNLRVEVMKGVEALQSGKYVEYTDETLPGLVEDVARRGRERARRTH